MKICFLAAIGNFTLLTYKDCYTYHFNIINSIGDIYSSKQTYNSYEGAELSARLLLQMIGQQ